MCLVSLVCLVHLIISFAMLLTAEALFVLLSLVLSELSHPQAKPLDFVCVSEVRKVMNKVKDLQEDLVR